MRVDVGGQPGHEDARLLAVVERHRLPQQVPEHADAQVAQEALAGAVDRQLLRPPEEVGGDHHHHPGHDGHVDGPDVRRGRQAVIDGEAHQCRPGQRAHG